MSLRTDNWAADIGVDPHSRLPRVRIGASECFATTQCLVMTATPGCGVSVCLSDAVNRVYGMNQFALPEPAREDGPIGPNLRFGTHAMELLINAMLAHGAEKPFLAARVFGGAHRLAGGIDLGMLNTAFALDFLQREAIPVAFVDIGGDRLQRLSWRVPLHEPRFERLTAADALETDSLETEAPEIDAPARAARVRPIVATLFDTAVAEASVP